jgi:8-oxo-dGTP diphosphatase
MNPADPAPSAPALLVTAGVLQRRGRFLLARRAPGRHLAGCWEFPGGKLEPGETPAACLVREFAEEFQVRIHVDRFLMRSIHSEPQRRVELLVYRVRHVRGRFQLLAHDALRWCHREDMLKLNLAPADIPVAEALIGRGPQTAGRSR